MAEPYALLGFLVVIALRLVFFLFVGRPVADVHGGYAGVEVPARVPGSEERQGNARAGLGSAHRVVGGRLVNEVEAVVDDGDDRATL